jgi:hypothetical protein
MGMRAQKEIEATHEKLRTIFKDTEFGGKLSLRRGLAVYVFAPHTGSTVGMSADALNEHLLRGHPGVSSEKITFLRFADEGINDDTKPLVYRYENSKGEVLRRNFGVGSEFFSVSHNGRKGYWHVLENTSARPIMLMISVERSAMEKAALRRLSKTLRRYKDR